MPFTNIFMLSKSRAYGMGVVHAIQIAMQGALIRSAVDGMAREQGKRSGPLLDEAVVLSHWWDDLGDDPNKLQAYPGLREKIVDILLLYDETNAAHVFRSLTIALQSWHDKKPFLPSEATHALRQLELANAYSADKTKWLHVSLLRLLASGIAQTEYLINKSNYEPMVDVVRKLSLELAASPKLRKIVALAQPEFLLGALASGSQELFPLSVPKLQITEKDVDVMTAANLLLGPPICFDKSIAHRRSEGIDMPPTDRVDHNQLTDYLSGAAAFLNDEQATRPHDATVCAYLKMIRYTHRGLSLPSPQSYRQLNKARAGFGSIMKAAFHLLDF